MDLNKNLEKYADLIVRIGLNLHTGDNLTIRLSEYSLPLARLVAKKAYQAGVGDIQLMFTDDSITLDRFLEAPAESFETYPEYLVDFARTFSWITIMFSTCMRLTPTCSSLPTLPELPDGRRLRGWRTNAP